MLPLIDIRRPKKQVLAHLPLSAAPQRVREAAARLSVGDHQLPQFAGFPCGGEDVVEVQNDRDDDSEAMHGRRHSATVQAAGHALRFRHSNGISWRVRRGGNSYVVLASSRVDPTKQEVIGWWTRSEDSADNNNSSSRAISPELVTWCFVANGLVLANMHGSAIYVRSGAAELLDRKPSVGHVRFEEALCLTAVFVVGIDMFGRPPEIGKSSTDKSEDSENEVQDQGLRPLVQRSHSTSSLIGLNHRSRSEPSYPLHTDIADDIANQKQQNQEQSRQGLHQKVVTQHMSLPISRTFDDKMLTRVGSSLMRRGLTMLKSGARRKPSWTSVA